MFFLIAIPKLQKDKYIRKKLSETSLLPLVRKASEETKKRAPRPKNWGREDTRDEMLLNAMQEANNNEDNLNMIPEDEKSETSEREKPKSQFSPEKESSKMKSVKKLDTYESLFQNLLGAFAIESQQLLLLFEIVEGNQS